MNTTTSMWPGDPPQAWAAALRSPDRNERLTDPPEIDDADAASIAAWAEDQRSLLPFFTFPAAVIGVIIIAGLLVGVLPLPGPGQVKAPVQWIAGFALLAIAGVLWLVESGQKRRRHQNPPVLPPVQTILCELRATTLQIRHGDGYDDTCVAIDAALDDERAAVLSTAFRLWLLRLAADSEAERAVRDELWRPPAANVFTSQEIFGPEAVGGYLVRAPRLPADGWGLIITRRLPKKHVGQLRYADVLARRETGWGQ